MRSFFRSVLLAGAAVLAWASLAPAAEVTNDMTMSDADITKSAEAAAPASVAKDSTIVGFDKQMNMRTVRKGTNGFTCMPDVPESPGPDPMCVDAGGMAWLDAWLGHKDPPAGVVGFGYMLSGGSDPDNLDPFATTPPDGGKWVTTGPHIMIFNVGAMTKDYPTGKEPDTTRPYVMYPNTPYAHLMVPIQ